VSPLAPFASCGNTCSGWFGVGVFTNCGHTLQVRLAYQHGSGGRRVRIITKAAFWEDGAAAATALGFNERAAAVLLARWVAYDSDQQHDTSDLTSCLDGHLVSLTKGMATFSPNAPESVALPPAFQNFPEYVFHLRRSPLLDVFNNAPDETVFFRFLLFRCVARGHSWGLCCIAVHGMFSATNRAMHAPCAKLHMPGYQSPTCRLSSP
jgi:hypothetical protein